MSEEFDEIVENLREPSSWLRIFFMIAFAVILYLIVAPVVLVIMIAQALFAFVTGAPNSNLKEFSAALSEYIHQMLNFLLFNSDEKPFPFSDFPSSTSEEDAVVKTDSAPSKKKASKKKTGAKKTAKKKAAVKKAQSEKKTNGSDDLSAGIPET